MGLDFNGLRRTLPIIRRIAVASLLVSGIGGGFYGLRCIYEYDQAIRDVYAADVTSALISDYIVANHGECPNGWEELRSVHAELFRRDSSWTLEELERRVDVQWLTIHDYHGADEPQGSRNFVRLKSGRRGFLSSPNPNERIAKALAGRMQSKD
jgi:hypothetical protein